MNGSAKVVNEVLVELFNDILTIEKGVIKNSPYNDLSVTEIHVLEAVGRTSRTMTDIATHLGITVGTLTTSINRLVKKGYVIRYRSKDDRRFVEIELTERGRLAYDVHESFHKNMVEAMIEKLSDEDNEILISSLQRLSKFFMDNYRVKNK